MSQREVVWILIGALLIAAAGVAAFVVTTSALGMYDDRFHFSHNDNCVIFVE
jgi:hypothetical protein